jgi:restriction system protein
MDAQRRRSFVAATAGSTPAVPYVDEELPGLAADEWPVLVAQAVIEPYQRTTEGYLIRAVSIPLLKIIQEILKDPSLMYKINDRKWEEIIVGSYKQSGLYDEVTLTPRSGDDGIDLIALKKGFGSVRILESVKRYTPKHYVKAKEVRDLLGALDSDRKASKAILSTTWKFAPRVKTNPKFTQYMPHRLELVDLPDLLDRLKLFTNLVGL